VLSDLAKSEACDAHKRIARGIVESLESLASNPVLRQVLLLNVMPFGDAFWRPLRMPWRYSHQQLRHASDS